MYRYSVNEQICVDTWHTLAALPTWSVLLVTSFRLLGRELSGVAVAEARCRRLSSRDRLWAGVRGARGLLVDCAVSGTTRLGLGPPPCAGAAAACTELKSVSPGNKHL